MESALVLSVRLGCVKLMNFYIISTFICRGSSIILYNFSIIANVFGIQGLLADTWDFVNFAIIKIESWVT